MNFNQAAQNLANAEAPVGLITDAVEGHLRDARSINARLVQIANRLRPSSPTTGESGGVGISGRGALIHQTECVTKEQAETLNLIAEIERFV